MKSAIHMILMMTLTLAMNAGLFGQETTTAPTTTAATTTVEPGDPVRSTDTAATSTATTTAATTTTETAAPTAEGEAQELPIITTRNELTRLLSRHPWELSSVLVLDPTLLSNEEFLANYPDLATFIAAHPEIPRNPRFYLAEFAGRRDRDTMLENILEPLFVAAVIAFLAFALAWFIRTLIEQRRWSRLSRIQTEVHNKILDRFGTTSELLEYIKTPAGTKFLESAPIPLHAEAPAKTPQNPPLSRALWSIQIGIVVTAAALGMLLISGRFDQESNESLSALGVIAFSIGIGFIASAVISLVLSKRLGLWQGPESREDLGPVR